MRIERVQSVFKESAALEKTILSAPLGKYIIPLTLDTGEELLLALTEVPEREEDRGLLKVRAKFRDEEKRLHYLELTFDFPQGLAWGTWANKARH